MSAMYPWERMRNQRSESQASRRPAAVATTFTPEEIAKLATLRTHLQSRAVSIELGLDDRRLAFARWLVEHGKLSEGVAGP